MDIQRDLRRLQLLDELRWKLAAFDYEPQLDPQGTRRAELETLIARLEDEQVEALRSS